MTSLAEKALKILQDKAVTGAKDFKDFDIMLPLGLSFPVTSRVITELEENGYIEVDHTNVNSHITLI